MPPKDMQKEVSIMGGGPLLGVSSHLLNLAELEAEGKAKAARLRAQQRGRVAPRKKGRLRAALRHLWRASTPQSWQRGALPRLEAGTGARFGVCRPPLRPHSSFSVLGTTSTGRAEYRPELGGALRPLPPQKEKG